MRAQQDQQRARLDAIQREIASSEARAASAREEADFEQCRATVAAVQAEVAGAQANCAKEMAVHNACEANNESRTAKGGTLGCLVGIAGIALGGIGAPMAAVSCGAGILAGSAMGKSCAAVTCSVAANELVPPALARHGLSGLPSCGGYLGMALADLPTGGAGVTAVDPSGAAQRAGLAPGDVLLGIDGAPVPTAPSAHALLWDKPPGQAVTLVLRRGPTTASIPVVLGPRMRRPGL